MSKTKVDYIEGATLTVSSTGIEAQRVARVSGLRGPAADRLNEALQSAGMPHIGDPHPTIGGLFATTLSVKPNGSNDAIVTIRYQSRSATNGDASMMTVGSSVTQVSSNLDSTGNIISVSYSPTGSTTDLLTQTARVSRLTPQTTLQFTRTESASPLAKARRYVGAINQTTIFESAPGKWLCVGIDGKSSDGGASYQVTYAFQLNTEGWQPTVSYTDPSTRQTPLDLVEGVGTKRIKVYPEAEFKELGL